MSKTRMAIFLNDDRSQRMCRSVTQEFGGLLAYLWAAGTWTMVAEFDIEDAGEAYEIIEAIAPQVGTDGISRYRIPLITDIPQSVVDNHRVVVRSTARA